MSADGEIIEEFDCFGSRCAVLVTGQGWDGSSSEAAERAKRLLLGWHLRFSRFLTTSELSRLNADRRPTVPVSPSMARFAQAVRSAGSLSGGLVDATLVAEIERAGYREDLPRSLPLATALELAPVRVPAAASSEARWRQIEVDPAALTVTRPPGVRLDSGGLAKGLFADVLGETLASHACFAVDCAGDLLIGGAAGTKRPIKVASPFGGHTLHTFNLSHTGVATSGIGRRGWLDRSGERPAHHLLDPSTGRPAFTGVVQVTALAPSALAAEISAKAALLSGPDAAPAWLTHGGVIVFDDGSHRVVQPPPVVTLGQLATFRAAPAQEGERSTAVAPT